MTDNTINPPAQAGFDWQTLEPDIRRPVQDATEHLHTLERRTSESIIEIGQTLIDVKARLGHGQFGTWLDAEFGWSDRTARKFITIAEKFRDKTEVTSVLGTEVLALLSADSTPDAIRESMAELARLGMRITRKDVRDAMAERKATAITVKYVERPQPEPRVVRFARLASTDADEYPEVPSEVIEVDPKELLISAARRNDRSPQPVPDLEEEDDLPPVSTPEECQRVVDALAALFAAVRREDGEPVTDDEVEAHLASTSSEDILQRFFDGTLDGAFDRAMEVGRMTRVVFERVRPAYPQAS